MEILVSLYLKYFLNSLGVAIKTKRPTTSHFTHRTISYSLRRRRRRLCHYHYLRVRP
jgi:hypothetical protein